MKISDIIKEKKHLCRLIFTDGKEVLIDIDVCSNYCLKAGDFLSEEKLRELVETSDYDRAKSRALWYLDRSWLTEKALYDKLCRGGFNKKASAKVIVRLKELGFLDDRKYAEFFAEKCIESNISKRETYQKMLLKGVPRDMAKEVLDNLEPDEKEQIKELLEKKYRTKLQNPENVKKVYGTIYYGRLICIFFSV